MILRRYELAFDDKTRDAYMRECEMGKWCRYDEYLFEITLAAN